MSNLLLICEKDSNKKVSFSIGNDVYAKLMEKLDELNLEKLDELDSKKISRSKVFEIWLEEKLKE